MNKGTPALFLDRDGVINRNHGYVYEIDKFEFFPEIMDICRVAQSANFLIVVVTNQSGIGRGYFSKEKFLELTNCLPQIHSDHSGEINIESYQVINDAAAEQRRLSLLEKNMSELRIRIPTIQICIRDEYDGLYS